MTDLVPIEQAAGMAPAKMRERMAQGQSLTRQFADNVQDSFPVLSIRGKVFRVRADGQEQAYKDPATGHPFAFLDVVLVNASRSLAKTYYVKGFTDGDLNPPDCWSLDSVRPDPSVVNKVNPTCQDCPMNAFGSRVTPDGKAAKACSDSRRMAIVLPHNLVQPEPMALLLRVPQSSLKNLRGYVELLARHGYEPGGCVTRLSFDYNEAYPKLMFNFVGPVTAPEFDTIVTLATSPSTAAMLNAPDFDKAASAQQPNAQQVQPIQRQAAPILQPDPASVMQPAGFGPGMAQPQPRPVQQPVPETEEQEQTEVQLIELPNGEGWLNPATGEITQTAAAEPEIDPQIIKVNDGRYYHRGKGAFVSSPYKDAAPAAAVPPVEAKKPATRKAKAPEAKAEAKAEAPAAAAPEPVKAKKNGGETPASNVVAASPKLEALLGSMVPKKD